MNDRLSYTVQEAGAITGFARSRIYKAIAEGAIKTFKTGRRRMVSAKALEEYVAKLERDGAQEKAA